jgi:tetratricopeptide (TPR) repeat protein
MGETAVLFLVAAEELDPGAAYINEEILRYTSQAWLPLYGSTANTALRKYVTPNSNLAVVYNSVEYLIDQFEIREYRYSLLDSMFNNYAKRNERFYSFIANKVGVLRTERANFRGALTRFQTAIEYNPYNSEAFENLVSIKKRLDQEVKPVEYLIHIRRLLEADPTNISLAVGMANRLEQLNLYELSYAAYGYSIDLYSYLYPNQALPANLYRPWILNCYYAGNYKDCIELANQIEKSVGFDLIARSVEIKASRSMGSPQWQSELDHLSTSLQNNYQKDSNSALEDMRGNNITAQQLAWYFNFVDPKPETALAYANRALSENPDSFAVRSIMAYSLAVDDQPDAAAELVNDEYSKNQIATLAMAVAKLSQGQNDYPIELLKQAVAADPVTFAAEKAKQLLEENGSQYISSSPPEMLIKPLSDEFPDSIVPAFIEPEKMVKIKLTTGGSAFGYGQEFDAQLIINNISDRPLIIGPEGFFKGRIRLDAKISGDLEADVPALISKVVYLSTPIKPGHHASIGLDIETGMLREILLSHPQASLDVDFRVYIDPVLNSNGNVVNSVEGLNTTAAQIRRPGIELNRDYLMGRLNVVNNGTVGQKVRAIRLFSGLLREQTINGDSPKYEYVVVPPQLLRDALRRALRDSDWTIRLQCLSELLWLEQNMSPEMLDEVAKGINDENWPIRFVALYLVGSRQGPAFKPVLDWAAQYDSNRMVVKMAVLLGGQLPEQTKSQQQGRQNQGRTSPASQGLTPPADTLDDMDLIPQDKDLPPVNIEPAEPAQTENDYQNQETPTAAEQPDVPPVAPPAQIPDQAIPGQDERNEIDDLLNF